MAGVDAGLDVVSIPPVFSVEKIEAVCGEFGVATLFTCSGTYGKIRKARISAGICLLDARAGDAREGVKIVTMSDPVFAPPVERGENGVVFFTGGTTGEPRPVKIKTGDLLSSAQMAASGLGLTRDRRILIVGAVSDAFEFGMLLSAGLAAAGMMWCDPRGGCVPEDFFAAATTLVARPASARRLAASIERLVSEKFLVGGKRAALAGFLMLDRRIENALTARLLEKLETVIVSGDFFCGGLPFFERYAERIVNVYGFTELCWAAGMDADGRGFFAPFDGVDIGIADAGQEAGELVVRHGGRELRPGDIGRLEKNGIILFGTVAAGGVEEIEKKVAVLPQVRDVVYCDGIVRVRPSAGAGIARLAERIAQATGLLRDKIVFSHEEFCVNRTGRKLRYARCVESRTATKARKALNALAGDTGFAESGFPSQPVFQAMLKERLELEFDCSGAEIPDIFSPEEFAWQAEACEGLRIVPRRRHVAERRGGPNADGLLELVRRFVFATEVVGGAPLAEGGTVIAMNGGRGDFPLLAYTLGRKPHEIVPASLAGDCDGLLRLCALVGGGHVAVVSPLAPDEMITGCFVAADRRVPFVGMAIEKAGFGPARVAYSEPLRITPDAAEDWRRLMQKVAEATEFFREFLQRRTS